MGRMCAAALIAVTVLSPCASGQTPLISTYLGGAGEDRLTAAGVMPDGTVLLGGVLAEGEIEAVKQAKSASGSGPGILVYLDPRRHEVQSVIRFPGGVSDLEVQSDGTILITGGFGTARLKSGEQQPLWQTSAGDAESRVTAGPDGGAVVLSKGTVHLHDAAGKVLKTWQVPGITNDVAFDPGTGHIFVTGFHNKRGGGNPVQVAYVYAYDKEGAQVWTAYDWPGPTCAEHALMADTRGYRVAVGPRGRLYLTGESAGGNHIWSRKTHDIAAPAPLAKGDKYQVGQGPGACHITFIGCLDPKTGELLAGSVLVARQPDGQGNTIRARSLAVDERGLVYVGGKSASSPPVSQGAIGGHLPGAGAFLCIFDPAFKRLYAAKVASGCVNAIAVGATTAVAAGEGDAGLVPYKALQAKPGGGTDGWVLVLPCKR